MNHVQQRAMERLGVSITLPELKRLAKTIRDGECKFYLSLGRIIKIYQVFIYKKFEAVVVYDSRYNVIKTIGPPSWIREKEDKIYFSGRRKRSSSKAKKQKHRKDKNPYERFKQKRKTREVLQRNDEFFSEDEGC